MGYVELARRLIEMGLPETEGSVTAKINRGAFPGLLPTRRHARHWRTYFACGGLALGLVVSGTALGESQSSANDKSSAQKSTSKQDLHFPPIVEPSYAGLIDQSACKPSQDDHQKDFCVAWRAAKATEDQAFWAFVTFWVGLAGVVFVVCTVHYTRVAAKAAQVSALAAERAVEESAKALAHAREVADRDLRPWLTFTARLTEGVDRERSKPEQIRYEVFLEVSCTNVGRSPASSVSFHVDGIDAAFANSDEKAIESLVAESINDFRGRGLGNVIAPSETHVFRTWCVTPDPYYSNPVLEDWDRSTVRLRIVIGVFYDGIGSDGNVFYTAKLFPVGKNLIQFLDLLWRDEMPLSPKVAVLGPPLRGSIN